MLLPKVFTPSALSLACIHGVLVKIKLIVKGLNEHQSQVILTWLFLSDTTGTRRKSDSPIPTHGAFPSTFYNYLVFLRDTMIVRPHAEGFAQATGGVMSQVHNCVHNCCTWCRLQPEQQRHERHKEMATEFPTYFFFEPL